MNRLKHNYFKQKGAMPLLPTNFIFFTLSNMTLQTILSVFMVFINIIDIAVKKNKVFEYCFQLSNDLHFMDI
jgi:hypothetical protein